MTLATISTRLLLAKKYNRSKEIVDLEKRIAHKLLLPKYAHLKEEVKPKPEVKKDGKKSKGY